MKKQANSRKTPTSASFTTLKLLTVWITHTYTHTHTHRQNKLWKILHEMGIPHHLNLSPEKYMCMSRRNSTRHGMMDWFQIRKGVCQGCILSLCLFKFYAECTMQNAGLDEAQAGIKIAGRNINNLRYADDTTFTTKLRRTKVSLDESERGE